MEGEFTMHNSFMPSMRVTNLRTVTWRQWSGRRIHNAGPSTQSKRKPTESKCHYETYLQVNVTSSN